MFKEGDKVRIKNKYTKDNRPGLWTEDMLSFQGKKATISKIEEDMFWGTLCKLRVEGELFFWFVLISDIMPLEEELE